jgi:hypothetical protein
MTSIARIAAWVALALVPIVGLGPELVPTLDAGLTGAAKLCAPREPATGKAPAHAGERARLRDPATLHVPRCGVA